MRDCPDVLKTKKESVITHLMRSRDVEKFLSPANLVDATKSVIEFKEEISGTPRTL